MILKFSFPGRYPGLICLLASGALMMLSGCGGASAANSTTPISVEQARTLVTATLDAWKRGETYTGSLKSDSAIQVADEDWLTGITLVDFELGDDSRSIVIGTNRQWPVSLKVKDARGKTVIRKVAYLVSKANQTSVIRQD